MIVISKHGIIGPFSSENNHDNGISMTKECFVPVLESFRVEFEKCEALDEKKQWFQGDDAPPHTAQVTIAWIHEKILRASYQPQR